MNLKKRESSEPKLKKKMSDFSFKVLKCQIQKFPIWHVIFVMLSWHILCFCKTFMMSKCPHTVIWRHVKCIYKGIIDLRFEFVWPEIFHLSGKYFEKQLIGMCQMPHISPPHCNDRINKQKMNLQFWCFLWVNCPPFVLDMKKIFKIFWFLIQPHPSKVNNKLRTTAPPKGDCPKIFILIILYAHLVKSILDIVVHFICWHHHCSKRWFTKPKNVSFWSKFVKTSQVGHNS